MRQQPVLIQRILVAAAQLARKVGAAALDASRSASINSVSIVSASATGRSGLRHG
jgi:hypothetical protein